MAVPGFPRAPQLLLGLALVILGGLAVASTMQLSRLKSQLVEKQQTITTLSSHNDELQQQMAKLEAERKDLEARITDLRNQLNSATGELGKLRSSVVDLQARYDVLDQEKSQLEQQVSRLTKERDEARESLRKFDEDKKELERSAVRLRERLAFLDRDYQQLAAKVAQLEQSKTSTGYAATSPDLVTPPQTSATATVSSSPANAQPERGAPSSGTPSQTVELPPIVVRKEQGQAATGLPLRAQVVEADEAHRFVVIDKGANNGVGVGMAFDILRGGAKIAQVVAVRVRPQLAACDFVGSRSTHIPQVGDLAVQHAP